MLPLVPLCGHYHRSAATQVMDVRPRSFMQNEDQEPEPKPASSGSMKPPRPPRSTVVGADGGGDDSGPSVKADYGCHEALSALSARYRDSDIHGAYSVLVEQEKLLREHIGFPGYKAQLAFTMAMWKFRRGHISTFDIYGSRCGFLSQVTECPLAVVIGKAANLFMGTRPLGIGFCTADLCEMSNVEM